ncbi:MAG TPA: carbonic anhydrase [Candidatus Tyrphobacter sp.]|nr:carbonic anhydrase [Candidatus Tyrphobacter sp.]
MEQVLEFKESAPLAHYEASGCFITCFDFRQYPHTDDLLKLLFGESRFDMVRIAGGAKDLATEKDDKKSAAGRNFILDQIRISSRLHGTRRVVLTLHLNCGAYGGSEAFGNNLNAEREHHAEALKKAAWAVSEEIPGVEVECFLIGNKIVWRV